jgi:hypothetical protein
VTVTVADGADALTVGFVCAGETAFVVVGTATGAADVVGTSTRVGVLATLATEVSVLAEVDETGGRPERERVIHTPAVASTAAAATAPASAGIDQRTCDGFSARVTPPSVAIVGAVPSERSPDSTVRAMGRAESLTRSETSETASAGGWTKS